MVMESIEFYGSVKGIFLRSKQLLLFLGLVQQAASLRIWYRIFW
jgi:hypothetical protein